MSEVEITEQSMLNNQPKIIDVRPVPKILDKFIDDANVVLQQTQTRLQEEIADSAEELMKLMGLSHEDGWYLDLSNKRFVKIEQPSIDVT